jgi:hypothetical protein
VTAESEWWDRQIHTFGYPLIACQHNGGPYNSEAFIAGMYTALTATALAGAQDDWNDAGMAPTRVMDQLDLVALHCGFILQHESIDEFPGWSRISFVKMNMDDLEIGGAQ